MPSTGTNNSTNLIVLIDYHHMSESKCSEHLEYPWQRCFLQKKELYHFNEACNNLLRTIDKLFIILCVQ